MPDATLELLIKTREDLAALDHAKADLVETKAAAEDTGAALKKALDGVVVENYAKSTKVAAAGTEHLGAAAHAAGTAATTMARAHETAADKLARLNRELGTAIVFGTDYEVSAGRAAVAAQKKAMVMNTQATPAVRSLGGQMSGLVSLLNDQVAPAFGSVVAPMLAMGVAALGAHAIYSNFSEAIHSGAALHDLALRTGESTHELVLLGSAFKAAGLGGDALGRSANLLEKVLGGVDANGNKADLTLARLGTSVAQLKPLTFAEQLATLDAAFAKIPNQSDRAAIAMKLFGRAGAEMLQLFDGHTLADSAEAAGNLADRLAANADRFKAVEHAVERVKLQFQNLWAAAAEQLLPVLNQVTHVLGGMNLGSVGAFLGSTALPVAGGLGLLAATSAADKMVFGLLEKMEEGTAKGMVRGVSNGLFAITELLPPAIAASIATAIVTGIAAAHADSAYQRVLADMADEQKHIGAARRAIGGLTTPDEAATTIATLRSRIAELEPKRAKLAADLAAPSARGARGVDSVSADPNAFVSVIGNFLGGLGGTNYINAAGEERDYGNDRSELLKLDNEVLRLKLELKRIATPMALATTLAGNDAARANEAASQLDLPTLRKEAEKRAAEVMAPDAHLADIDRRRAPIAAALAAIPAAANPEAREALTLKSQEQLNELLKEEQGVRAKIAEQKLKDAAAATRREVVELENERLQALLDGDTARAKILGREIELKKAGANLDAADFAQLVRRKDLEEELDAVHERAAAFHASEAVAAAQLASYDATRQAALQNVNLTVAERIALVRDANAAERAWLATEIERTQAELDQTNDLKEQEHLRARILELKTKEAGIDKKTPLPKRSYERIEEDFDRRRRGATDGAMTSDEGLRAGAMQWFTQLGTTGEIIAQAVNGGLSGAVSTLSSGIWEAAKGTKSWGDAFRNLGDMAGRILTEMIVKLMIVQTIESAFGWVTGGSSTLNLGVGDRLKAADAGIPPAFGGGGMFVTKGRTQITVGDNPGGAELVSVIPLSGIGQTTVQGRALAMAGGGVALVNGGAAKSADGEGAILVHQTLNFASGVTREEVAGMIPQIVNQTKAAVRDAQRRRRDGF